MVIRNAQLDPQYETRSGSKRKTPAIAVVGMGCQYPGADSPRSLWENVLSKRRQFREMPDQRMPLSEYYSVDRNVADKTYGRRAAVIDGFEFDWASWRIPKTTFEATDIVHWLALATARQALQDTGWDLNSLPTQKMGVVVGNTLTGEYTRANTLRVRWPYVRRAFLATAEAKSLSAEAVQALLDALEAIYKSPFAKMTEDSLAGGLSNTIAGRICNAFDFDGGGYTVDGACASSLIAVKTAAAALVAGELDCAIAGGVDVSLDPMELVGFAKTGALTATEMTVYDRQADGFIPGEGCGFVVLKRLADARREGDYVYATLDGWGISSDGQGGLTAPSGKGQAKALRRAYAMSESDRLPDFIEGHGTGTKVGDRAELMGIEAAIGDRSQSSANERPVGVTSFKSIVGHTKAAAGIGGFIKAVIAVNQRIIPPMAGCTAPSLTFEGEARSVYPVLTGEIRPASDQLRAGISAMGFGGINSHAVLTSADRPAARLRPSLPERALMVSSQETELMVFSAASMAELQEVVQQAQQAVSGLSQAELTDYAAHLSQSVQSTHLAKAALVTGSVEQLEEQLQRLAQLLEAGIKVGKVKAIARMGIWISHSVTPAQIGFLFPGQGSQRLNMARMLVERYAWARKRVEQAEEICQQVGGYSLTSFIYRTVERAATPAVVSEWKAALTETQIAQPAICLASLLWCEYLKRLGIQAAAVCGHSLGELSAFWSAGAMDARALLRWAAVRGQVMAQHQGRKQGQDEEQIGRMVSLVCGVGRARSLVKAAEGLVVVANCNSPKQTVISGEADAVESVVQAASAQGIEARPLPVSTAFHSPLMAEAADAIRKNDALDATAAPPTTQLFSSVDGTQIQPDINLRDHFAEAITAPVDFVSAVQTMSEYCDLMIEVGPGRVLSGLANDSAPKKGAVCWPIEGSAQSDRTLNKVLATTFVRGSTINWPVLYENRLVHPFVPAAERQFITNPCERPLAVPATESLALTAMNPTHSQAHSSPTHSSPTHSSPNGAVQTADWTAQLAQYFSQRGAFLAEVIRSDLNASPNGIVTEGTPFSVNASINSGHPNNGQQNGHQQNDHQQNGHQQNGHLPDVNPVLASSAASLPAVSPPVEVESIESQIESALIDLIVERTGYSPETVQPEMRLLDELNLDSIKATEIVVSIAGQYGAAEQLDPADLANASLRAVAGAIATVAESNGNGSQGEDALEGSSEAETASWVRNFAVEYVPQKIEQADRVESWTRAHVLILSDDLADPVAAAIAQQLSQLGAKVEQSTYDRSIEQSSSLATHYIAILPQQSQAIDLPLAEMVARLGSLPALATDEDCVAYVQFGGGRFGQTGDVHPANCCAAAFARSLHLERSQLKVRTIDCDARSTPSQVAEQVIAELPGRATMRSAGYDATGRRSVPQAVLQQPQQYVSRSHNWSDQDVVLATGGAKGITAECALAFAQQTGTKMVLVGRSPVPKAGEAEGEIAQTLARYREAGRVCRYYSCDITDAAAVRQLVQTIQTDLGTVSGVIHGAGLNRPRRVEQVTQKEAIAEVSPKLIGAMNLMQALSASPPKLFAAFSSIIGVTGMQGNAWYGFANEALDVALRQFSQRHPKTQTIAMAYSIWDEVGMGARMGSVHQLAQMGIAAIPKAEGVRRFLQLTQRDPGVSQVLIAARLGGLDTWYRPTLPAGDFRFVERVERVEPGVEGVVRSHLTLASDPYLKDHFWRGSYLFPTVFGLEAMAQTAAYVIGQPALSICQIEAIDLQRPIVVDPEKGLEIELRATVGEIEENGQQRVCVGIRSAQTGFAKDHFSATLVVGALQPGEQLSPSKQTKQTSVDSKHKDALYNSRLLFQGERFQQIEQVVSLDNKTAVFQAHVQTEEAIVQSSFASTSSTFLLGDPYYRDSLLQSLQLTIPQDICLPIQIDKIELFRPATDTTVRTGTARLLDQQKQDYLGEIISTDETGVVTERLSGYRLRILETHAENPTATELALQLSQPEGASQPLSISSHQRDRPVSSDSRYQHDGPQGQLTYEQRFQVSFKESAGLGRKVYFSQYFRWVGQIRELPMERIASQMMADFLTGDWGMVTNSVSLRIVGEATAYDTIQARAWIGVVAGSSFTTYIEFCKVLPDEKLERLAIAEVRATWVALVSYGVPVPKPFPPYLANYIEQFTAEQPEDLDLRSPHSLPLPDLPAGLLNIQKGEIVAQLLKQSGSRYGQLLRTETFQTTLEESNLVGNVYYGNYFIWQGRILDLFLYSVAPEYLRVSSSVGELVCTYTRMDYLREAMPFDKIRAQLYVDSVFECGAVFRFEFFREQPDGSTEKLHVGEQEAIWVKRDAKGAPIATAWPAEIADAFRQGSLIGAE